MRDALAWLGLWSLFCYAAVAYWCVAGTVKRRATLRKSRNAGTRRVLGYEPRYASTIERERGTRTQETATTAGSSSSTRRGAASTGRDGLTLCRRVNSYIAPGSSIYVTGILGVNGEHPPRVA